MRRAAAVGGSHQRSLAAGWHHRFPLSQRNRRCWTSVPLLQMTGISKRFPGVVALDPLRSTSPRRGRGPRRRERRRQVDADEDSGRAVSARRRRDPASRDARCRCTPRRRDTLGIGVIHQELEVIDTSTWPATSSSDASRSGEGRCGCSTVGRIDADAEAALSRLGVAIGRARWYATSPPRSSSSWRSRGRSR